MSEAIIQIILIFIALIVLFLGFVSFNILVILKVIQSHLERTGKESVTETDVETIEAEKVDDKD